MIAVSRIIRLSIPAGDLLPAQILDLTVGEASDLCHQLTDALTPIRLTIEPLNPEEDEDDEWLSRLPDSALESVKRGIKEAASALTAALAPVDSSDRQTDTQATVSQPEKETDEQMILRMYAHYEGKFHGRKRINRVAAHLRACDRDCSNEKVDEVLRGAGIEVPESQRRNETTEQMVVRLWNRHDSLTPPRRVDRIAGHVRSCNRMVTSDDVRRIVREAGYEVPDPQTGFGKAKPPSGSTDDEVARASWKQFGGRTDLTDGAKVGRVGSDIARARGHKCSNAEAREILARVGINVPEPPTKAKQSNTHQIADQVEKAAEIGAPSNDHQISHAEFLPTPIKGLDAALNVQIIVGRAHEGLGAAHFAKLYSLTTEADIRHFLSQFSDGWWTWYVDLLPFQRRDVDIRLLNHFKALERSVKVKS